MEFYEHQRGEIKGFYPEGDRFCMDDGWGKILTGTQDDSFVYRGQYVFPKAMTSGNYRTPEEAPYSFGTYILRGPIQKITGENVLCDYDDRLRSWYPSQWKAAHEDLRAKHRAGASYSHVPTGALSEMLSKVYGQPVTLQQLLRGCNVGSGYPFHIFISLKV